MRCFHPFRLLLIPLAVTAVLSPAFDAAAREGRGRGREAREGGREYRERGNGRDRLRQDREPPRSGRYREAERPRRGFDPPPYDVGPPRGQRGWGRGERLPPAYRGYRVPNPGRMHLRAPPPGYDWVPVGRDVYLVQRSTGLVLDAVPLD